MTEMSADLIGSEIVKHQRGARFADTSIGEWQERLVAFLSSQAGIGDVAVSNVREVGTAAGGSNGTLLFDAAWTENGERQQRGLVLRFMPTHGLFHIYDVEAQFALQKALKAAGAPVPGQLWIDVEGKSLGRAGYVMEQVEGQSTPMTWMTSGIIADARPEDRRQMQINYLAALAQIHAVDWRAAGLEWMETRAAGTKPIEREVNWYWGALEYSGVAAYIAAFRPMRDWLIANEPDGGEPVVCHGDANFGNYLYDGTDVSAVVDWEMSFLGTPECDLSFIHIGDQIIQHGLDPLEGTLSYSERLAEYERISGRKLSNLPYYELFTAYRLAVINVLTFRHFPAPVLEKLLPVIERGPRIAAELAGALGVECRLPPSGTIA